MKSFLKGLVFYIFIVFFASPAMGAMDDLLVFYGYLNSFNSSVNAWNNDAVVTDIGSKYQIAVFGDGVADPNHPDYANASYIINKLKTDYPGIEIYGYVTANQALQTFQSKASQWDTIGATGIFLDEYGYDFGVTRQQQNERLLFVKQMNFATKAMVNCWNVNHALGILDDPAFPNATFNPSLDASLLDAADSYMLESFVWNWSIPGYWGLDHEIDRIDRARLAKASYPINLVSITIIDESDPNAQMIFDRTYKFAHMGKLDAAGSADLNYGASSATTAWYVRPPLSHL